MEAQSLWGCSLCRDAISMGVLSAGCNHQGKKVLVKIFCTRGQHSHSVLTSEGSCLSLSLMKFSEGALESLDFGLPMSTPQTKFTQDVT